MSRVVPVSFAQQGLWLDHQQNPATPAYNMTRLLRFDGGLDTTALERALRSLARRHETLRTTFQGIHGVPHQIIADDPAVTIQHEDIRTIPEEQRQKEADTLIFATINQPFDLERGPLVRWRLIRTNDQTWLLVFTLHHIVADGWSIAILAEELTILYDAYCRRIAAPLTKPLFQYADYANWQHSSLSAANIDSRRHYWQERLNGAAESLRLAQSLGEREASPRGSGCCETFTVPTQLTTELKNTAREEQVTLFVFLLACFQSVLHLRTGLDDFVIATVMAGRTRAEFERMVGLFSNLVPLRVTFGGRPTFKKLLQRTRRDLLEAFRYELPFVKLIEAVQPRRRLGETPFASIVFGLHNFPHREWTLPGLRVSSEAIPTSTPRFDFELIIVEELDGLHATIEYDGDLYSTFMMHGIAEHYQEILSTAHRNIHSPVQTLGALSSTERHVLTEQWNQTQTPYERQMCIHQLFEAQAKRTPHKVAVICEGTESSYADLNLRADCVAGELVRYGVGPETIVGVCVQRSIDLAVALLAVWKAGGAFVPLDPTYPENRLALIIADSGTKMVITQPHLAQRFSTCATLVLDGGTATTHATSAQFVAVSADNLAYVLYTSGSSGRPKGVAVSHRNVLNLLAGMEPWLGHEPSLQRWLAVTTITFDISILELCWPLLHGGQVVLLPEEQGPLALRRLSIPEYIEQYSITHLQCTPSLAALLTRSMTGLTALANLRVLMIGGEVFPEALAQQLNTISVRILLNVYGPTETTIWSTVHRVQESTKLVPVGRPIANTRVYILNENLEPLPVGTPGELYIGGAGVARGYLGNPRLTAERFLPDPFTDDGARMYRTGDRARHSENGTLELLGRLDNQVKIRGHRIELEEVEARLKGDLAVADAVVTVLDKGLDTAILVAYVVPNRYEQTKRSDTTTTDSSPHHSDRFSLHLRSRLADALPQHMVPQIRLIDDLPRLPNGKLNRAAVSALPYAPELLNNKDHQLRTASEKAIAAIFQEVLGLENIGASSDFFSLGGHSLLAMQVLARIASNLRVHIEAAQFVSHPTVGKLAHLIDMLKTDKSNIARIPRVSRRKAMALSFDQEQALRYEFQSEVLGTQYHQRSVRLILSLTGELNIQALENAINEIIARHDVLRTAFISSLSLKQLITAIGQSVSNWFSRRPKEPVLPFRQVLHPRASVSVEQIVAHPQNPSAWNNELATLANMATRPFDYATPPLLRAILVRKDSAHHVLIIAMSHLIADGLSIPILRRELEELYSAFATKKSHSLPTPPIAYTDFAHWQRERLQGEHLENLRLYWAKQLLNFPVVGVLELGGYARALQKRTGSVLIHHLDQQLSERLHGFVKQQRTTMFILSVTAIALHLRTKIRRDRFGLMTHFSNRIQPGTDNLIGNFVHSHPLCIDMSQNPTVTELIGRVQGSWAASADHQEIPQHLTMLSEASNPPMIVDIRREATHTTCADVSFVDVQLPEINLGVPITIQVNDSTHHGINLTLSFVNEWFRTPEMTAMLVALGRIFRVLPTAALHRIDVFLALMTRQDVEIEAKAADGNTLEALVYPAVETKPH